VVAFLRIDHVIAIVMRDSTLGARRFTGVAANANFRVNQVLLNQQIFCEHGMRLIS
jgi:hypothetical protein